MKLPLRMALEYDRVCIVSALRPVSMHSFMTQLSRL